MNQFVNDGAGVPMTPLRATMHRRLLDASAFKFARRGHSAQRWLAYAGERYPVAVAAVSQDQLEAICAMSFTGFTSSMERKCRGAS